MTQDQTKRLTAAVDAFVAALEPLLPPTATADERRVFAERLSDLLAEALNAASAQSAGAVLVVRAELLARLAERERGA